MQYIVITSIFEPTEAVIKFSKIKNFKLLVVGDKKTPKKWSYKNVNYFGLEEQNSIDLNFSKLLPLNHYSRKMMGYLFAIRNDATIIYDTDDDNIPKENWSIPDFNGPFKFIKGNSGFYNVLKNFSDVKIWPRGFPLQKILSPDSDISFLSTDKKNFSIGIWQGLVDEDPDVDAIYRLTIGDTVYFKNNPPIILESGTICPINTQNTAFTLNTFPLLYIPAYVSFRFTDILRGLIAQPILWAAGYRLGFQKATVVQHRNPHNLLKDFESEIPCFLYPEIIIEIVSNAISPKLSIKENLFLAYEALTHKKIVMKKELILLDAWLKFYK